MNKKGFTLIEILAVVVILGFVSLITMPVVQKNINDSKKQAYETQIDNIERAAKDWASENLSYLPEKEGTSISITLYTLMSLGYIDNNLVDPLTEKYFDPETIISITKKNNNYKYQVHVIFSNEKIEIDKDAPIIFLNGSYVTYVEPNSKYEELGIYSDDDIDYDIEYYKVNDNGETLVTEIDSTGLYKYKVIYTATNESGKTSNIYRTVIIKDNEAPVITVPITQTILSSEVEGYDLMEGVSVTDNSGESIIPTVSGSLKSAAGSYVITYKAIDSSGNKKTKKRTIIVENISFALGEVVYFDPITTNPCSSSTFSVNNIKSGTSTCYKWNVIEINDTKDKNKIDIMLDHNIVNNSQWMADELNYKGPMKLLTNLRTSTTNWTRVDLLDYTYDTSDAGSSSYGTLSCSSGRCEFASNIMLSNRARVITIEEIVKITKTHPKLASNHVLNNWNLGSGAESWFYFSNSSYGIGTHTAGTGDTTYSWLVANTVSASGNNDGATSNAYGSDNQGYWTLSPYSGNRYDAWLVGIKGGIHYRNVTNSSPFGIRPVINVNKGYLKK